ncbi:serine hydrolase domain-containing protein [Kineococcus sp. SYSU DK004]|uniref:serine hydrolase domain-containing protein n=1 Tax=Kineococcus sp. SYSU DK004 TaxID=3383125 RepID=UPI003D7D98C4
MSSSLVLLLLAVLSAAVGLAATRTVRRRHGRLLAAAVGAVTTLALLAGSTVGWAHLSVDRSGTARAIAWMDADVDDIDRFPARRIPAGRTVLPLRTAALPPGTLDEVTVAGRTRSLAGLVESTETEVLLVLRDDEVVHERYANGGGPDRSHTSFSVAKSFLSTLVGIAVDRGDVRSLDDPVTDYLPELLDSDERFRRITLRHLLSMSSGICYSEHGTPWSDDAVTYYSTDLRATALSARICEPPGRTWVYDNYNPLLVGMALERATGTDVADYAGEHLWGPAGMEADGSWSLDSEASGFEKMESGVNARPRDFARLGYLFAHEGRVGNRQVVSAEWVREATARDTSADPAEHYQLWWWVDTEREGRFFARGNKGQFVYVDPATDVVAVRLGRDHGGVDWPEVLRDVTDRVNESSTVEP